MGPPSSAPAGVITCLFTDVEGSTRLMKALGPAYDEVLELHNAVLRGVWRDHGGHEVKTIGDAFFVVFADAATAVRATVAAQQALARAPWSTARPVRVRAGLHTGWARPGPDGDYSAMVVNQAARVVGAAHGGQVLLSAATAQAAAESASGLAEVELVPLGRFRVRDFDGPLALFAAGSPAAPPCVVPPRVRPADGHNLVRPRTSLVGREADAAHLRDRLSPGVVVSLLGPGGAGKTRLATEVAIDDASRWQDGAWFVDLSAVEDPVLIAGAIGDAVGCTGTPGADRWQEVREHLAEQQALVVLDNCEQVAAGAARVVAELLQACPDVGVLATSRVPLGLRGEVVHRLGPLAPDVAAALFCERAGFGAHDDPAAVTALCAELDGLPLAIELAAARAGTVPPADVLARLRRSPRVLRSDDPTLPDRQRTLERLLDWSWELLRPEARTVLGRLSVFAAGFTVDAAEVVAAGGSVDPDDVAELVWTLVDASLVRLEQTAGATRYGLLTTVRAHATARAPQEDLVAATEQLGRMLVEQLGPERAGRRAWIGAMAEELDNVRWAIRHVPDLAVAHTLAWSIGRYHHFSDAPRSSIQELRRLLDARPEPGADRVGVLALVADLHLRLGELDDAEAALAEAEALGERVGLPAWDTTCVLRARGEMLLRRDDPAAAAELARGALDPALPPWARGRLGDLLGIAAFGRGDLVEAARAFEGALEAALEGGLDTFLAVAHANLAEVHLRLGDEPAAARHQAAALVGAREHRQPVVLSFAMVIASRMQAARGQAREAVVLQARADELMVEAGWTLYAEDARDREAFLERARAVLGEPAFADAVAAGRALDADDAADLAEEVLLRVGSATAAPDPRPAP